MSDEKGLETVEYAIILGLIVAGTIGIIAAIGVWVNGRFSLPNTRRERHSLQSWPLCHSGLHVRIKHWVEDCGGFPSRLIHADADRMNS